MLYAYIIITTTSLLMIKILTGKININTPQLGQHHEQSQQVELFLIQLNL